MNWNNVDLNSPHERGARVLVPYTFGDLLLEIHCNLKEVNEETVRAQFYSQLDARVNEAKEIFEANLSNIVRYAKKERAE